MKFFCRLLKDCLKSDGYREYLFPVVIEKKRIETLLSEISANKETNPPEFREIGGEVYYKISHSFFRITGFLGRKAIKVYYRDDHPMDARKNLESIFESWT